MISPSGIGSLRNPNPIQDALQYLSVKSEGEKKSQSWKLVEDLPTAARGRQHGKGRRSAAPSGSRGRRRWCGKSYARMWLCADVAEQDLEARADLAVPVKYERDKRRRCRGGQVRLGEQKAEDTAAGILMDWGGRR